MPEKILGMGITFDDVLLIPGKSSVQPSEVNVSTRLTKDIALNIPIVSAAMDTVTEAEFAIALAREGGIGIIHRNMSPEAQAGQVDMVKRSESGVVSNPITLGPDQLVRDARAVMRKYNISGVPITDMGILVGMLTTRDLRFVEDDSVPIRELMTSEGLITAAEGISMEEAKRILHEHRIEKLPVVDSKKRMKGLITFKDIKKSTDYPNACKDEEGRLRVGAAVGVGKDAARRVDLLVESHVDVIAIDTAHGHSENVIDTLTKVKTRHRNLQVIAGNIATAAAARDLIKAGADGIKVGVGPGAICTTRVIAGIGVPQITAIMECAAVAGKVGVPLIADGGVKYSGDIVKAIAAGGDTVMIGSLFAGADETPGEIVLYEGRSFKIYRGMGSVEAMRQGSRDRYAQEDVAEETKLVAEGIEGRVPYKGKLSESVFQLVGGLRAGMGYCGVRTIDELKRKGSFIQVTAAGLRESHPHDVIITKEAPNYRLSQIDNRR
ncbi:MAG: IMP dehydrogenase [Candidatus Latescibacteria bacterium]|nr:IMP dehydrogenase [Candidatus Latescibacterota bacterium]NIM66399.1 IMP dehydrogenase [Candidatus Latescibacterota bacterium]NIO02878.1 IMP dehydrogenase [Candidatus Latescibacterota bacterium]NIO30013.1 IMP dehydrogenase [Candidatus Latescibacterota bacterium]NIO57628.1 IMP dehydrogenase [Candidatus Latescibacterota bacterium]